MTEPYAYNGGIDPRTGKPMIGYGEVLPPAKRRLPTYDSEGARLMHELEEAEIQLRRKQKANAWVVITVPFCLGVATFSWIVAGIGYLGGSDLTDAAGAATVMCILWSFGAWVVSGVVGSSLSPESVLAERCRKARALYHDHQGKQVDIQYRLDNGIYVSRDEVQGKGFDPYTGYGW